MKEPKNFVYFKSFISFKNYKNLSLTKYGIPNKNYQPIMLNLLSPRAKEEADCFYKVLIQKIEEIDGNDHCEYSITWKSVHKQRGLTKQYKTNKHGIR